MIGAKLTDAIVAYGAAERERNRPLIQVSQLALVSAIERELQLPLVLARQCATALRSQAERLHTPGMPYSREAVELRDLAKRLDHHVRTHAREVER